MTATESDGGSRCIPAEIKRQVLLESGHMCAIPTCRWQATQFAHIEPYSKCKSHEASNIIALCPNHHDLYDNKKVIDQKSMRAYKVKLQFLNKRYTMYELRLLALLAEKRFVLAAGEVQTQGLLKDGLIENAKTFMTHSITETDDASGERLFEDSFVMYFAARLTEKGRQFIEKWKSESEDMLDAL